MSAGKHPSSTSSEPSFVRHGNTVVLKKDGTYFGKHELSSEWDHQDAMTSISKEIVYPRRYRHKGAEHDAEYLKRRASKGIEMFENAVAVPYRPQQAPTGDYSGSYVGEDGMHMMEGPFSDMVPIDESYYEGGGYDETLEKELQGDGVIWSETLEMTDDDEKQGELLREIKRKRSMERRDGASAPLPETCPIGIDEFDGVRMSGAIPMTESSGMGQIRPSEMFYRRPDLDEVAVENVRKKLESEKTEREIQFREHKTERERSLMFLESRKQEREMLERRSGVCREMDGTIHVRSDLPPSRSIGGAMRSRQTLTSESMSRGDAMFDDDGMQPIRQQDLEALESQERMFGPEAYHRFQQQIFRELEMSRLADSAFNRESLESRMGTLYQRKKMMERSRIMEEEQERERRKDMVTEDVELSLMEVSALDDVLYRKIKEERKQQEKERKERMENRKKRKQHEKDKEKK
eukprot:TRINITY_DN1174_c0_g1_i2.p2 TRINITY_DN1174_c0_g1~~TRINITY_DN1174_c0_g1_i2.p2  ORF type:complete len:464 (-),score=149.61 TRINITY_DN1174_c0_g1_i2:52-1443(-)